MTTKLRIVLAGYEEEHIAAMPASWRMYSYAGNKCYGTTAAIGKKQGNDANRHNERLWFSPHCINQDPATSGLFAPTPEGAL